MSSWGYRERGRKWVCVCNVCVYLHTHYITHTHTHLLTLSTEKVWSSDIPIAINTPSVHILISKYIFPLKALGHLGKMANFKVGTSKIKTSLENIISKRRNCLKDDGDMLKQHKA